MSCFSRVLGSDYGTYVSRGPPARKTTGGWPLAQANRPIHERNRQAPPWSREFYNGAAEPFFLFERGFTAVTIPTYTPTMLSTYERCPHQYHRQYVQKLKESAPFSFERTGGTIAHGVLQGALEVYRRTGGYP